MAELQPFKNYFGLDLAAKIQDVYPPFPAENFIQDVAAEVESLELKARVRLIAANLRRHLPQDYAEAIAILLQTLGPGLSTEDGMFNDGWFVMPIAQFVEDYGLDHFDISLNALYEITKRNTSEFAVRPYILRDSEAVLARLREWVHDPDPHVRRWVSEGTRPRLPWGMRLDLFIRDPSPTLKLLEILKDDPEIYVRKSVANHLNDIAKDHPALVVATAERWYAEGSEGTRWIVRHALRTLIKKGDPAALAILGFDTGAAARVSDFDVQPGAIKVGDSVRLSMALTNDGDSAHNLVVDFVVHFVKAKGKTSAKVFKWTTTTLPAGTTVTLQKSLSMKPVTTRVYYPGHHRVEVQVNGQILAAAGFELTF